DVIQVFPIAFNPLMVTNSYFAMCVSTILITVAAAYCIRRMLSLRFLNLAKHVQTSHTYNFVDNVKTVLEKFSGVTSITDLGIITQKFFNDVYSIPLPQTNFYIKSNNSTEHISGGSTQAVNTINTVDHFVQHENNGMDRVIYDMKMLIYDEVAFSNFYEPDGVYKQLLAFLNTINADIFLPIYEKQTLIGYIIVERYPHPGMFFGDAERDEMLVFSSYLSNLAHLLYNKNFDLLVEKKREIEEELHFKQQEIKQYKESFRSFLRNNRLKDVGVILYKAKRFSFANKAGRDMVPVNLNTQEGHPLTKIMKDLVDHVEEYRTPQTTFTHDFQGNKLIIAAFPHLEEKSIIITVYYPAISDVVKRQMSMLENPNEWDFLLYLETTESGKLINQLIPGSGEILLNFKISLLKAALSKQAVLLETAHPDDLGQMVELIHHVSLRERLEVIALHTPCKNNDLALKLFGINPMLNLSGTVSTPLLAELHSVGTIFIENIQFLDMESQEHLADFLHYGMYRPLKSEHKVNANVRIICSTNQNLQELVHAGTFSKTLFDELKSTTLIMPSLADLPEPELRTLTDGFTDQLVKKNDLKSLMALSDKEKAKLLDKRPVSLADLKSRVQQLLHKKAHSNHLYTETQVDSSSNYTDPGLIEAARLGKQALKNPRIMTMLWTKFKSQAKIAEFLDVNRSSVNRRCKEYNLE
ncbi:MAG: sigma 54-interacting transcriptional regulator, partial [Candidatus Babeliales bacterium]